MNQLMSDEAVYITAPATPGLLKSVPYPFHTFHFFLAKKGLKIVNIMRNVVATNAMKWMRVPEDVSLWREKQI